MLKEQIEVEKESAKTSELKVIDANRRIDRLMSEKSDFEKVRKFYLKFYKKLKNSKELPKSKTNTRVY